MGTVSAPCHRAGVDHRRGGPSSDPNGHRTRPRDRERGLPTPAATREASDIRGRLVTPSDSQLRCLRLDGPSSRLNSPFGRRARVRSWVGTGSRWVPRQLHTTEHSRHGEFALHHPESKHCRVGISAIHRRSRMERQSDDDGQEDRCSKDPKSGHRLTGGPGPGQHLTDWSARLSAREAQRDADLGAGWDRRSHRA